MDRKIEDLPGNALHSLNKYPRFSYNDAYAESLKSQRLIEQGMHKIVKDEPRSINEGEYEARKSTTLGSSYQSEYPNNLPLDAYKHNVGDLAMSEKRITISNFLQNLNDTTTLLGTDKILRTVDNKNIVTNIGTQTPENTPGQGPPRPPPSPPSPPDIPNAPDYTTPQKPRQGEPSSSQTPPTAPPYVKPEPGLSQTSPGVVIDLNSPSREPSREPEGSHGTPRVPSQSHRYNIDDYKTPSRHDYKDDQPEQVDLKPTPPRLPPIVELPLPLVGVQDENVMMNILPKKLNNMFMRGSVPVSTVISILKNAIKNLPHRRASMGLPAEDVDYIKRKLSLLKSELSTLQENEGIPINVFFPSRSVLFGGKVYIHENKPRKPRPAKRDEIPFGDILIDQHNLFNDIVSVYRNGKPITGLPNRHVSRRLARIIYDLAMGTLSTIPTTQLSLVEQDYLAKLLKYANLNRGKAFTEKRVLLAPTLPGLQKQLIEAIGEVKAGNNNPEIVSQIVDILTYLQNYYNYPKEQVQNILKSLKIL